MKLAVLGYGGIARRYLDILRGMDFGDFGEPLDVAVMRARPIPLNEEHHWARLVPTMRDLVDFAPDCAIIASPASEHIRQGQALADIGANLLIEKPLSVDLNGVDRLISTCNEKKLTIMVGYNMAYLEPLNDFIDDAGANKFGRVLAVQANVGQYLPDWRFKKDYRDSVSVSASLGGGVIMELSHEIEYVDRLIGGTAEIFCFSRISGLLETDAEDCADIMMKNHRGIIAHIHMDMLQRKPIRECTVFGSTDTELLDIISSIEDRNKMYRDQLLHFFDCVKNFSKPRVDGKRGRRVMELILAARESSEKGIKVKV